MSKKDERIAELEAEVSRLREQNDRLVNANATLVNSRIYATQPCVRPHSDEFFQWTSPTPPFPIVTYS